MVDEQSFESSRRGHVRKYRATLHVGRRGLVVAGAGGVVPEHNLLDYYIIGGRLEVVDGKITA